MRILPTKRSTMMLAIVAIGLQQHALAHVTLRAPGPLSPSGAATVSLVVPNERYVDTTRIVLEVPDDFLRNGGRITRIEYPPDWKARLEKEDMPEDIYANESAARKARAAGQEPAPEGARAEGDAASQAQHEQEMLEQMRRKWVKRVVFEEGTIPPDGFREFRLNVQLPAKPGQYRFPATQLYADGRNVEWTQLVPGAARPAPTLVVAEPSRTMTYVGLAGAAGLLLGALLLFRRRNRERLMPARATSQGKVISTNGK